MMSALLYATRSFLPSPTANAVQSAHMATAFHRHFRDTLAVYRTSAPTADTEAHFAPFGLVPPPRCHPIHVFPRTEHTHWYLLAFLRFFRSHRFERPLVYTRSARLSWAAYCVGLPSLIELHDPLIPIRTRWLRRLLSKGQLPGLVTTTPRLRDDVVEAVGLPPERILVAGGASRADYVTFNAIAPEDPGRFNVGYAGSAYKGKGVEVLLACAERLPEVTFHLIGPSRKACACLGEIPRNVVFYGYRNHLEVIGRLKGMDALLLPNQSSVIIRTGADIGRHTSPLKLFEYLSTGRPMVASALPVFDGILRDNENALCVPPEDPEAFCHALRELERNTKLRDALGKTAQSEFLRHHTWDHRAKRILSFLEDLELL